MPTPGARLRETWAESAIMIPGVFNALTAKTAERLRIPAVYLSGGALSAGWAGVPDIGLLSVSEFAEQAAVLAGATSLPLLCDADTGFGDVLNVERTVRLYEGAGAAGLHIEDQVMPKRCGHLTGKALIEPESMIAKILRGRGFPARLRLCHRGSNRRAVGRGVRGRPRSRAGAYREAGADMIFPEALETAEEFARFAKALSAPLLANMTEFGRSPLLDFHDLAAMGYRAVLYPLTALRSRRTPPRSTLRELRDTGSQRARSEDADPR